MRALILKTEIKVGDAVEVIADISQPGRFVEAGRGTVSARRYDFERCSAELSVRMHDGRGQKVWPAGLRMVDVENDVPRHCRVEGSPGKRALLANLDSKNTLVETAVVAADSQKQRALGAESAAREAIGERDEQRRIADDLRRRAKALEASNSTLREELRLSRVLQESAERAAKTAERQMDRALDSAADKAEKVAQKRYLETTAADRDDATSSKAAARCSKQAAFEATARADKAERRTDEVERQNLALEEQVAAMEVAAMKDTGPEIANVAAAANFEDPNCEATPVSAVSQAAQVQYIAAMKKDVELKSAELAVFEAAAKAGTSEGELLEAYDDRTAFERLDNRAAWAIVLEKNRKIKMEGALLLVLKKRVDESNARVEELELSGVPWLEDRVLSLESQLEEALSLAGESVAEHAEAKLAVARLGRILGRLPRRGKANYFSVRDNELFFRIASLGTTAEAAVQMTRVLFTHVFADDAKEGMHWEAPSESTMRTRREQLKAVSSTVSGIFLGLQTKWKTVGNDSTKVGGTDLQSAWVRLEDGSQVNIMCVQPDVTAEGTRDTLVGSIDANSDHVQMLRDELERLGETEALAAVPDAEEARDISKVESTMQDGCSTATLAGVRFGESVLKARKEKFIKDSGTAEAWDSLLDDSPLKLFVQLKCANHFRVLWAKEYGVFEAKLDACFLASLQLTEGVSTARANELSLSSLFRSLAKGIGAQNQTGAYTKGDRDKCFAFFVKNFGDDFFADWGRGEHGSRHDWILTFAWGAFYNIPLVEAWLESTLRADYEAHVLRDSIFIRLELTYTQAKIFVAAVRFDKVENYLRALTNLKEGALSPADFSVAIGCVVLVCERLLGPVGDGVGVDVMFFYEESYRVFDRESLKGIPDQTIEALLDWEKHEIERTTRSLNGVNTIKALETQRQRLYCTPQQQDWLEMRPHVVAHTIAWALATLASAQRNCPDYLEPHGKLCRSKQSASTRELLKSFKDLTNDPSEQPFSQVKNLKKKMPTLGLIAAMGLTEVRSMKILSVAPGPAKYQTEKAKACPVASSSSRAVSWDNLPGGEATKLAVLAISTKKASKGATREEILKEGAGGALASFDVKAAEAKLAENQVKAHNEGLANRKRKLDKHCLAQATLLSEHQYTLNPADALCDGMSDTKAVECLKAQLGLVDAMGWKKRLLNESPALDLTLGQTKTKTSGTKELRAALLTTLRAIATLAQDLKLEVIREPKTKQLCRDLSMPNAKVVARRTTFLEANAAVVAAAVAEAADITAASKASKAAADAEAAEIAATAKAAKDDAKAAAKAVKDAAKAVKDAAKAAKALAPVKPKKRRAPEPTAAAEKNAATQNATRTSARNRRP